MYTGYGLEMDGFRQRRLPTPGEKVGVANDLDRKWPPPSSSAERWERRWPRMPSRSTGLRHCGIRGLRHYLDQKLWDIGAGTAEVRRMIIARELLRDNFQSAR
jgi:hypothetical protein